LIGCLCAILAILVNGSDIYPMGAAAFPWNLLMRILAVAIMVLLIGSARRSYDREWWSARTDPLTGALNRTGFLEIVSRKDRADQWCLLGYVDLDGLKRVNDEFGHSTGDEVLKAFAQEVRKNIRETDAFARIGGDEFILYQGVGTEEEASRLAQQLHSRINAVQSRLGHLTRCSMGALIIEPDSAGVSIADIDCADRLMYKAKRQGAGLCIALRNGETAGVVTLPLAGRADRQRPQHFNHLSAA
jgi:diguanylate cyclase (GGDEF)-like protein